VSEAATNYFFDTSALVKRYHDEAGTAAVDEAFDGDGIPGSSAVRGGESLGGFFEERNGAGLKR
jgi:hypothetical protein